MTSANDQRSVFSVLRDIGQNLQDLVRSEVKLVKAETKAVAHSYVAPVKLLAAGGIILLYGGGLLLLSLVHGLSAVMPLWASYLAVGAVLSIAGGIVLGMGRSRLPVVEIQEEVKKLTKAVAN